MTWKPNRWLAAFLALFLFPLGLIYLGGWRLAATYFLAVITAGLAELVAGTPMYSPFALMIAAAGHAFWLATRAQPKVQPWYSRWYGMVAVWIGVFVVVATVRAFLVEPFRVPSTAMEPSVPLGSYLIVSKVGYGHIGSFGVILHRGLPVAPPARGAIVVFESPTIPGKHFFKRVLGVPGDSVTFRNKVASINGKPLAREAQGNLVLEQLDGTEYWTQLNDSKPAEDFEVVVPPDHYFMVGDNRDGSDDSRRFGAVPGELLLGKVVHVFRRGASN